MFLSHGVNGDFFLPQIKPDVLVLRLTNGRVCRCVCQMQSLARGTTCPVHNIPQLVFQMVCYQTLKVPVPVQYLLHPWLPVIRLTLSVHGEE